MFKEELTSGEEHSLPKTLYVFTFSLFFPKNLSKWQLAAFIQLLQVLLTV